MARVHPAAEVVARIERMWEPDKQRAQDRANLIVQRLIELGHIKGQMQADIPIVLDED